MAHQKPPNLAFCTPGQNEIKNKIQGMKGMGNIKLAYVFLNERQGMKGMGNI